MITVDSIQLTENERDMLLKWSAIFFENGVRLMNLANFINEKNVDKEILASFLQEKVRGILEHYETDAFMEMDNKRIGESAHRMILSMLEMIEIEGDMHEDTEIS